MNIISRVLNKVADAIIAKAKKTPYVDIPGYMERYWLVPFSDRKIGVGGGPVSLLRRPFARLMQKFDIAARVHVILRSDQDRDHHDHPWSFVSVILRGGYYEYRPVATSGKWAGETRKWYGPGSIIFRRADDFHRLELLNKRPATTLFITFKYQNRWGFLVQDTMRKVGYRRYLAAQGASQ